MERSIPFHRPIFPPKTEDYVREVLLSGRVAGGGIFTKKCHRWLEENTGTGKALLTTSGTHALEMAAILISIEPGDEVILPSYTFPSTANAFALRGVRLVFVDINPETMNINEGLLEPAITKKTKAIAVVHYGGVSCNMDAISEIAKRHGLFVIEDAAHAFMATYKGRPLGSLGDIGAYSFHESKNLTCGEGGAILINREAFSKRAEIIWEKGTNRLQFLRGETDKYTWQDIGSSYLPSDLNAAVLLAQLENAKEITEKRLCHWNRYHENLKDLEDKGLLERPHIPRECGHPAHLYYIKVARERDQVLDYLKKNHTTCYFHYVPLHTSPAGLKYGRFVGEDRYTTRESERLIRLPLYCDMSGDDIDFVCGTLEGFYKG